MGVEQTAVEGGEVTFVGGKAVEQTTEGESAQPADEREAAVKAVREALKAEGKKAASEAKEALAKDPIQKAAARGADGKFQKSEPASEETELVAKPFDPKKEKAEDDDTESLKRVLKERKQIAAKKASEQENMQRQANALRQYEAQLRQQTAELEQERARFQSLRRDPARAIKEIGYDPEQFILDLAHEGTPEGQARRDAQRRDQELAELRAWRQSQEQKEQQSRQQYEQQKASAYRQHVEREFLSVAMKEEKHPHLSSLYKGQEQALLNQADLVAEQYRDLTGKEATFEDVAEYLEDRYASWYKSRNSGAQAAPPVTQGRSTPGTVTGRTLNPNEASERRMLGTTLRNLDGDERLAAAREAVAAAIHASGER